MKPRFAPARAHSRQQAGSTLVMCLIVLLLLMMLGVSGAVVARSQLKLAGNFQFQNLAKADAESAMTLMENWVSANNTNTGFITRPNGTSGGIYPQGTAPDTLDTAWADANSTALNASGNQRYMIERLTTSTLPGASVGLASCSGYGGSGAACAQVNVYRVTGRGVSLWGSNRIVQSIYSVRN